MKWISVEDRLPSIKNIIVNYKFGVCEAVHLNGVGFVLIHDWKTKVPNVTHWMPLPDPPLEENPDI